MDAESRHIERLRGIVKFLDNTARNVLLYPVTHPSVRAPARRMRDLLDEYFRDKDELVLGVINDVLYIDDYFFYDPTPYSREILNSLARFEVQNLALRKGFTEEDVLGFARLLKTKGEGRDAFLVLLQENGVAHAALRDYRLGAAGEDIPAKGLETYRGAVSLISNFFDEIKNGQLPPLREAQGAVDRFVELVPGQRSLLLLLSSLKGYDTYTYQHSVNVGILSLLLGEALGYEAERLRHLSLAGILHDIGKVRVPEKILQKPGQLSRDEWQVIMQHPLFSAEIVEGMGAHEDVVRGVREHHCYFDGTGYPALPPPGRAGEMARIISVADAYDAITTLRPYKDPTDPVAATRIINNLRGTRLEPGKVDAFVGVLGIYPPGCMVRLSSNQIAQVLRQGREPGRPCVRMVLDEHYLPFIKPGEVDLSEEKNEGVLVAGLVEPVLYGLEVEMPPAGPGA
jgi:putative nucleotidyltransferase with HDIG domain